VIALFLLGLILMVIGALMLLRPPRARALA
jgi:hypothetical protein